MRLSIRQLRARLNPPFATSAGTLHERDLLLVGLEASGGRSGWGEAAPLGWSLDAVLQALESYRPVLAGGDEAPSAELMAACAQANPLPPALAAIDLALWDLAGRHGGEPVWRLLGVADPAPVQVNATIASPDRAGAASEAARATRAGFRALKLKVGLGDDAGRLAAVRAAAGPDVAIRLDANGAWSLAEARAALSALAPAGLELCEEPVHGVAAIRQLAASAPVPIAIDESAADPDALEQRACTAICLKISRCGGISATIEAARRARLIGYEVYLASLLDGPLGISAALHVAALLAPDRPCGLATLDRFADRPDPLEPRSGEITVPASAGLGEELLAWYG